jgi:hypothetical protein
VCHDREHVALAHWVAEARAHLVFGGAESELEGTRLQDLAPVIAALTNLDAEGYDVV